MIDEKMHYLKVMTFDADWEGIYFLTAQYGVFQGVTLSRESATQVRDLLTAILGCENISVKAKWQDESK